MILLTAHRRENLGEPMRGMFRAIRRIVDELPDVKVVTQDEIGLSSDAKEAIAFAIMGNETMYGYPSNVCSATGASRPVILGNITPAPRKE